MRSSANSGSTQVEYVVLLVFVFGMALSLAGFLTHVKSFRLLNSTSVALLVGGGSSSTSGPIVGHSEPTEPVISNQHEDDSHTNPFTRIFGD